MVAPDGPRRPGRADFSGQVACVSGGATGIGAASARMFALAGAKVVIADVNLAAADSTVAAIKDEGGEVRAVGCDVGDEAQVTELIDGILEREGRLDVVHANAGLESVQKATDATLPHWERVLNVNLTGVFLICRTALRHMYERGSGWVVITSSPHAVATVPDESGQEAFGQLRVDPYFRATARRVPEVAELLNRLIEWTSPARHCLVHGDFSAKNVLCGAAGDLWVIDFQVAHRGHRGFDPAFLLSHLVMKWVHLPASRPALGRCVREFARSYVDGLRGHWLDQM